MQAPTQSPTYIEHSLPNIIRDYNSDFDDLIYDNDDTTISMSQLNSRYDTDSSDDDSVYYNHLKNVIPFQQKRSHIIYQEVQFTM